MLSLCLSCCLLEARSLEYPPSLSFAGKYNYGLLVMLIIKRPHSGYEIVNSHEMAALLSLYLYLFVVYLCSQIWRHRNAKFPQSDFT